jgi:hypothetical protein
MNDELMRKISDAMDTEEGVGGDPELRLEMSRSPEAARYARHLSRLQTWMAAWPLSEPTEEALEALAQKIDARLGEEFAEDYTAAPVPEEGAQAHAEISSAAIELTVSAVSELAGPVSEEGSVPVASASLRRDSDERPAAPVRGKPPVPRVPPPRPVSVAPGDAEETELDAPVSTGASPRVSPPAAPGREERSLELGAGELRPVLRAEAESTQARPPTRPAVPTTNAASERDGGRFSIPMPSAGPRLELGNPGAVRPVPAKETNRRAWVPAVLAAAAVAVGVIGAGSLMMSGPSPSRVAAPAAATVAPVLAGAESRLPTSTLPAAPSPAGDSVADVPPSESSAAPESMTLGAEGGGLAMDGRLRGPLRPAAPTAAASPEPQATAGPPPSQAVLGSRRRELGRTAAGGQGRRAEGPEAPPAARGIAGARAASAPVEEIDRATVQSVMQGVEPAVRACAGERHGSVQVDVVVQGTGRVSSATVTGNFQGSPEGSCIARAVRSARFPAFTGEPLRFRYPFAL